MNDLKISRFGSLDYAGQEAINTLCTNLSFSGESMQKIMITSAHASEGKSFISMNIMRTIAMLGKRVVLVDADLRRSFIKSAYGLQFPDEKKYGLAHFLAGKTSEGNIVYRTNLPGACMIPVGREIANPLPLLNSARFSELMDHLSDQFDYVLVDAPPVGVVVDAAEIAKSCDGTLFVVGYNEVRRRELIEAKEQIEQTGCPIIGAVLNQVDFDNYMNRNYYYKAHDSGYEYYEAAKRRIARNKRKAAKE